MPAEGTTRPRRPKPINHQASAPSMDADRWLEEHGDALFAYAMQRVRKEEVAEDLVQETLLTAIERKDSFEGRSSVRTWLIGILRFKMLQQYRGSKRESTILNELPEPIVEAQFTKDGKWKRAPSNWGASSDQPQEQEEFRKALSLCLGRLPARTAEAFLLSEQHDASSESLSSILQVSMSNVYVLLYRARTALRKCLEQSWFGESGKGC